MNTDFDWDEDTSSTPLLNSGALCDYGYSKPRPQPRKFKGMKFLPPAGVSWHAILDAVQATELSAEDILLLGCLFIEYWWYGSIFYEDKENKTLVDLEDCDAVERWARSVHNPRRTRSSFDDPHYADTIWFRGKTLTVVHVPQAVDIGIQEDPGGYVRYDLREYPKKYTSFFGLPRPGNNWQNREHDVSVRQLMDDWNNPNFERNLDPLRAHVLTDNAWKFVVALRIWSGINISEEMWSRVIEDILKIPDSSDSAQASIREDARPLSWNEACHKFKQKKRGMTGSSLESRNDETMEIVQTIVLLQLAYQVKDGGSARSLINPFNTAGPEFHIALRHWEKLPGFRMWVRKFKQIINVV